MTTTIVFARNVELHLTKSAIVPIIIHQEEWSPLYWLVLAVSAVMSAAASAKV